MQAKITPRALAHFRKRVLGLSIDQFAAFAGVSNGRTIRRWEDGTQTIPPYIDILHELASNDGIKNWLVARAVKEWNMRLDKERAAKSRQGETDEVGLERQVDEI